MYNEVLTCKQSKICSAHGEYSISVNELSLVFSSVFYIAVLPLRSLEANMVLMFHVQFLAPQEMFFSNSSDTNCPALLVLIEYGNP